MSFEYYVGQSWGHLVKEATDTEDSPYLCGRLVASASGWLLLSVPNDIVRGLFDALDVAGAELPLKDGKLNAHISIMRPEEIATIPGGIDAITERGHMYHFNLGPLQEVEPGGWGEMSRVWFVKCKSPELERLRKSYGLSGLPNEGKYNFHITVAVRRKKVLVHSDVSKAAGAAALAAAISRESCPSCSARLERGDGGNCNRCGKPWPLKSAALISFQEIEAAAKRRRDSYAGKDCPEPSMRDKLLGGVAKLAQQIVA